VAQLGRLVAAEERMLIKILRWGALGAVALGALAVGGLAVAAQLVPAPAGLGVRDGRLAPCPPTPNCVSTQADPADRQHYAAPAPFTGPADETQERIRALLAAEPRVELLRDEPGYIHAVFRTPTMRYPDDVEFYLDEAAGLIHIRSASRLGSGDAGVNRARVERLLGALR
jgi:uncharacterized protein (DUF1499 family)